MVVVVVAAAATVLVVVVIVVAFVVIAAVILLVITYRLQKSLDLSVPPGVNMLYFRISVLVFPLSML